MATLTAPRRLADVHLIAQRSIARAAAQHVQAVFVGPGQYRVASKSQRGAWYDVQAQRIGQHVQVVCSCPGGQAYRDERGSSCCKHAVGVARRLLRVKEALAGVPAPGTPQRISTMARAALAEHRPEAAPSAVGDNAQRAYEAGHQARLAGKPRINPWQRRGPAEKALYAAWDDGWLAAGQQLHEHQEVA